jgi:3-oxoacyl-[acyl-carrier protein] reductase
VIEYSLSGRRALVCGSTQGIGRACAVAFAELGASVTLFARHEEALAKARDELPRAGDQEHDAIVADFRDWEQVRERVQAHLSVTGPVQILLNNTGGPPAGTAFEAKPEDYRAAFEQHVLSGQALVQCVVPGMRDAGFGRIINIISTSVIQPIRGLGVSNTIRAAVANWARTLASELGHVGITVNNILPGYTATARLASLIRGRAERAGTTVEEIERQMFAQIPARRFATAEEIAAAAAFLASPAASYVNGVSLPVDGGRLAAQ